MFLFHIIFLDPDYVVRIRIRIIQLTEFSARWMRAYTCPGLTLPIRGVGVMGGGGGGWCYQVPPPLSDKTHNSPYTKNACRQAPSQTIADLLRQTFAKKQIVFSGTVRRFSTGNITHHFRQCVGTIFRNWWLDFVFLVFRLKSCTTLSRHGNPTGWETIPWVS